MKKRSFAGRVLRGIYSYVLFFLMVAFLVTCTTSLFVSVLSYSLEIELTNENLQLAAKITFANVVVLSLLITAFDAVRRRFTTQRITTRITDAAQKMVKGDFSVRIAPASDLGTDEKFNEIIDCFNTMAEELEGVETLRSDFIANVSHEMKTPLAIMQNYGTLLQAEGLSEEKRIEYAKGVTDGSRRMAEMMTNILKLNRLENQQLFPKTEIFDLGEQLCGCLLQFENVWENKGIDIETDLAEGVLVSADNELLSLVWNNLLSNAFKFTDQGGRVTVKMSATDHHATVQISDTGCGMTREVGEHIFEKFYQGDTSHSTRGNGLGLALVKRVTDIINGDIGVESTPGEGSTFTVRIRRGDYEA